MSVRKSKDLARGDEHEGEGRRGDQYHSHLDTLKFHIKSDASATWMQRSGGMRTQKSSGRQVAVVGCVVEDMRPEKEHGGLEMAVRA